MTHIRPEETELQGYWIDTGSAMTPDSNWERIRQLTTDCLEYLASSSNGREQLYLDNSDGRLWELTPVVPSLPAGPPLLRGISKNLAKEKYDVSIT